MKIKPAEGRPPREWGGGGPAAQPACPQSSVLGDPGSSPGSLSASLPTLLIKHLLYHPPHKGDAGLQSGCALRGLRKQRRWRTETCDS